MKTITFDDTLYQLVPKEPTPEHIESMALRFDHGHGIKQDFPPETDDQFKMRQELNRRVARQMYEEATGNGFFKIAAPTPPAQPAEQPPIPESLWRSILDAGLTLHKEGDKWWVEKAQPADRMPLTEEQRAYVVSMWKGGNWNAGDIIDAVEAAHGITEP